MSIEKIVNVVDIAGDKLPHMEGLHEQVKDEVEKLQHTRQRLINDIEALKYKLSVLDKTAFSIEQECKRIKQELHELIDKKDRIEKLIENILNDGNEGYFKLKHIINENVKAALSENKQVILVSFTDLLQTLKSDPEMVKLIYNIPRVNDSEQPEENTAIKYLESNKDSLSDLAEKHYENLIEALTNNVIDTAASSPSNPVPSLPQSSSRFPNLSNQSNSYGIEKSESFYDNGKDNIAE